MVSVGTFVSQLYGKQRVNAVDSRGAYNQQGVRAAGRQPAQQGSQVVERHHALQTWGCTKKQNETVGTIISSTKEEQY